jgi:hypothetical protein
MYVVILQHVEADKVCRIKRGLLDHLILIHQAPTAKTIYRRLTHHHHGQQQHQHRSTS